MARTDCYYCGQPTDRHGECPDCGTVPAELADFAQTAAARKAVDAMTEEGPAW